MRKGEDGKPTKMPSDVPGLQAASEDGQHWLVCPAAIDLPLTDMYRDCEQHRDVGPSGCEAEGWSGFKH